MLSFSNSKNRLSKSLRMKSLISLRRLSLSNQINLMKIIKRNSQLKLLQRLSLFNQLKKCLMLKLVLAKKLLKLFKMLRSSHLSWIRIISQLAMLTLSEDFNHKRLSKKYQNYA